MQIDRKLKDYFAILESSFYVGDDVIDVASNTFPDKQTLINSLSEKEKLLPIWSDFLGRLKIFPDARIRDFTRMGGRHSFNCLFMYKSSGPKGLIISISIPFRVYGFYFYKFIKKTNVIFDVVESYSSIDSDMTNKVLEIEKVLKFYFKEIEAFDSKYAKINIQKLEIDGSIYQNIDLWKAIFTTNTNIIM